MAERKFDPDWYKTQYPDVGRSGLDPYTHYLKIGRHLGRDSHGDKGELPREGRVSNIEIDISQKLRPANQLRLIGAGEWESLGNDPYFFVDLACLADRSAGWYKFSVEIDCDSADLDKQRAKFYINTGSNFSENETIYLESRPRLRTSRLYKVDALIQGIRFDPMECASRFNIRHLSVSPVGDQEALEIFAARLVSRHPEYRGKEIDGIVQEFQSAINSFDESDEFSKLVADYQNSFSAHQNYLGYSDWVKNVEQPAIPSKHNMLKELANFESLPVISIVVPTYNTPEKFLKECIDSIIGQSYPYWELCIADDASPKEHVKKVLLEYQGKDRRIKVVFRPENGHISEASNSALALATGSYVALLDHDDTLPPSALFFIAKAINDNSGAKIFYTDEDKLDLLGNRVDPHFKPNWSPDLFYSQNYISHLGVYRTDLLRGIGGFRRGVEGSQDQDLMLRCLPHVDRTEIVHVPRILYHWRIVEGSTALASGEKSYTTVAGVKALTDYFASISSSAKVEAGRLPNTYKVTWPLPSRPPKVSLIIPTRDRKDLLEVAVNSILEKTNYENYEIIIVDNGSVELETLRYFEEIQSNCDNVTVYRYDFPFNYSAINNFGVEKSTGTIVGLVNNDIEVINAEWLTEMVRHVCRDDVGCVGAKLYYSDGTIQHAGVILGVGGIANHAHKHYPKDSPGYFGRLFVTQNFSVVTAACLLLRRDVYHEVGGLNEQNLPVAFNDVDLCLKVREAGYRNVWTPYAELYHHESVSRGSEDSPEKMSRFMSEIKYMESAWGRAIKSDPFYNPNLTLTRSDYSLGM